MNENDIVSASRELQNAHILDILAQGIERTEGLSEEYVYLTSRAKKHREAGGKVLDAELEKEKTDEFEE